MSTLFSRAAAIACVVGLPAVPLSGCAVSGGGDGNGGGVTFADYYEPSGVSYHGWSGGRYMIGPPPPGEHVFARNDVPPRAHAYRPAPASSPVPSIPSSSRGGGQGGT
jgi:hypothetical protein